MRNFALALLLLALPSAAKEREGVVAEPLITVEGRPALTRPSPLRL